MINYKYELEKSPKKHGKCPNCGNNSSFRYYQNIETGERAPEIYGKCERLNNCNYINYPKDDNFMKSDSETKEPVKVKQDFTENRYMAASILNDNSKNVFLSYIKNKIPENALKSILENYHIGTTKNNQPVFWCVDSENRVCSGKIIKYDSNFRRLHGAGNTLNASKLIKPEGNFTYCFFGEHLLQKFPNKTVAIVESEKTAIIASIWLESLDYVWLSCGGSNGLTNSKMAVLKDRQTIFFPDCDKAGRESFNKKFEEYKSYGFNILLHDFGDNFQDGQDIADFWQTEINKPAVTLELTTELQPNKNFDIENLQVDELPF